MVPVGFTLAGGALVAWTAAVGTAVGAAAPPVDGADVACGGTAVGEVEPLDTGVAVAEDPQANNYATNSRTIALGRCLIILGFDLNISSLPSPWLRCANNNAVYR